MIIAQALYHSNDFGNTRLIICSDEETAEAFYDEDTDFATDEILYASYESPISDIVMQTAAKKKLPAIFKCNDIQYELLQYKAHDEERFYNRYRENYVVQKERLAAASEIFVYSQRCRCVKCFGRSGFDSIINICGSVPLRDDRAHRVDIDLQKCMRCNKYFIDIHSLEQYEKRYGRLSIRRTPITGNEDYYEMSGDIRFRPDSILSRNGYSTRLRTTERRKILANMIECGYSKAEIKDKLTEFIRLRGEKCPEAASIWEDDLEFVNDYGLHAQSKVKFK